MTFCITWPFYECTDRAFLIYGSVKFQEPQRIAEEYSNSSVTNIHNSKDKVSIAAKAQHIFTVPAQILGLQKTVAFLISPWLKGNANLFCFSVEKFH